MKLHGETAHPLPAQRAFLVQVHAEAEVTQGRLAGRVYRFQELLAPVLEAHRRIASGSIRTAFV